MIKKYTQLQQAIETLREYVKENEVVFQTLGNLVEVANEKKS